MQQPSARSLSQLFSQLTDHHVSFTLEPNAALSKAPAVFARYVELPDNKPVVVRAERAMVAVFAGALLGMPEDTAIERALEQPINESVRDAMHEVLNIGSTALSTEGRVVLKELVTDPLGIDHASKAVMSEPRSKSTYRVSINGKPRGIFALFS